MFTTFFCSDILTNQWGRKLSPHSSQRPLRKDSCSGRLKRGSQELFFTNYTRHISKHNQGESILESPAASYCRDD
jgi:hypothetical protein